MDGHRRAKPQTAAGRDRRCPKRGNSGPNPQQRVTISQAGVIGSAWVSSTHRASSLA